MKDIRSALILILGGIVRISEVVLQKQFHNVVQSEKVFLVLTLGGVVLTLSDKGGVGELIGIKLQIACTGRCCTLYSVQYHLQRKYKRIAKKKYI